MRSSPRRPRRVSARKDEIQRLARERLGITSTPALAQQLGVDPKTLASMLNDRRNVSTVVLATLLDALDAKFEDAFTIIPLKQPAA
jgi:transcriptional regulator with XRE-family HTH domain